MYSNVGDVTSSTEEEKLRRRERLREQQEQQQKEQESSIIKSVQPFATNICTTGELDKVKSPNSTAVGPPPPPPPLALSSSSYSPGNPIINSANNTTTARVRFGTTQLFPSGGLTTAPRTSFSSINDKTAVSSPRRQEVEPSSADFVAAAATKAAAVPAAAEGKPNIGSSNNCIYTHEQLGSIYPFSYSLISSTASACKSSDARKYFPYSLCSSSSTYSPGISRHIDISSSSNSIFYTVPLLPKKKTPEVLGTPSILKPFRQLQEPTRFNNARTVRPNIYVPPVRVSRNRKSESNSDREVSDSTTASVRSVVSGASPAGSLRSDSRQTGLSDHSDLQVQRKPLATDPRMPLRVRMRRDEYFYTETSTKATQTDEVELTEKRRRSSSKQGRRRSKAETVDRSTSPISQLSSAQYLKKLEDLEKITGHFVIQRFFTRTDQDFTLWLEQQLASKSLEQGKSPDQIVLPDNLDKTEDDVPLLKPDEDKSQIQTMTDEQALATLRDSIPLNSQRRQSIISKSNLIDEPSCSPRISDVPRPAAIDTIDDIIEGVAVGDVQSQPETKKSSLGKLVCASSGGKSEENETKSDDKSIINASSSVEKSILESSAVQPSETSVDKSIPESSVGILIPEPSADKLIPQPSVDKSTLESSADKSICEPVIIVKTSSLSDQPNSKTEQSADQGSTTDQAKIPQDQPDSRPKNSAELSPTVIITELKEPFSQFEKQILETLPEEKSTPTEDQTKIELKSPNKRQCTLSDLIPCECFAKHFLQEESIAKLLISLSPRTSTPLIELEPPAVIKIGTDEESADSFEKFQSLLKAPQQKFQLADVPKPDKRKIKHSESFAFGTTTNNNSIFAVETTVLSVEGQLTCQEFPPFVFPHPTVNRVRKSTSYDSCLGTDLSSVKTSHDSGNSTVGREIEAGDKIQENLNCSQDSHSQTLEDLKASIDEEIISKDSGLGSCSARSHQAWYTGSADLEIINSGRLVEPVSTIYELVNESSTVNESRENEDSRNKPTTITNAGESVTKSKSKSLEGKLTTGAGKGKRADTTDILSAESDTESEIVISENYHARSEAETDTEMTTDGDAVADDNLLAFGRDDEVEALIRRHGVEEDNTDVDDDDKDNDLLARMELDELRLEIDKPSTSTIRTTCTQTNRSLFSSAWSNNSSASSTTTNGTGSYIDLEVVSKKYPSGNADVSRRNYLPSSSSSLNFVNCNMNLSVKTDESKFKMSVSLPGLRPKVTPGGRPLGRKLQLDKPEESQDLPALWAHVRNRLDSKVSLDLPASDLAVKGDSLPGNSRSMKEFHGGGAHSSLRETRESRNTIGKYQRPQHSQQSSHQQYFLHNRQNDDRIKRSLERLSKLLDIEK